MKTAEIGEILSGDEPVLLTRAGRVSGVYLPLEEPGLPDDLRRELLSLLGRHISESLEARGITEEEILEDFDAHRRRRR